MSLAALLGLSAPLLAEERTQRFDADPGWDGHNNRLAEARTIRQDFGFSPTAHAGGSGPSSCSRLRQTPSSNRDATQRCPSSWKAETTSRRLTQPR